MKIELGQTVHILANIGVIGGILLLAYELRQNNDLMAAEARFNRLTMVTDAWRFRAEHGDLAVLRQKVIDGEPLEPGDERRVEASIMAVLVLIEWTYRELGEDSPELDQVRAVQRYNFSNDPSYARVWHARKHSFEPSFVRWVDEKVITTTTP